MPSRQTLLFNGWLCGGVLPCLAAGIVIASIGMAQAGSDELAEMSLDSVLQGYLEALGGQPALDQIHTVRVRGRLLEQGGKPTPYSIDFVPQENRMRMDFAFQGIPGTLAYDGRQAWQLPPLLVADKPIKLDAGESQSVKQQADFYGTLIQPENKGHLLELMGVTTRDNISAWEIRATKANGDSEHWFLDLHSYLPFRVEAKSAQPHLSGQTEVAQPSRVQSSTVHYTDYRAVDIPGSQPAASLMWPFSVRVEHRQQPSQLNQIDSMQINLPLAASRFDLPANAHENPPAKTSAVKR